MEQAGVGAVRQRAVHDVPFERMDFDKSYRHLLFNQDYTSFALK